MGPDDTVHEMGSYAAHLFPRVGHALAMSFGAATDRGLVREVNEDQFAVIRRARKHEVVATSLPEDALPTQIGETHLFVVADGIGGGPFGELASRLALEAAFELAGQASSWIMKLVDLNAQQLKERVQAYAERVEARLREATEREPRLSGMGTTWASAYVMDDDVLIVNIGDSRIYLYRDGICKQLTRDHTLARALEATGVDPADVQHVRHVLVNYLSGDPETSSIPEIHHMKLQSGDRLLLCTDGLSDLVDDETITSVMKRMEDPQEACDALIREAIGQGGKDNVTVIVASFTEGEKRELADTQTIDATLLKRS